MYFFDCKAKCSDLIIKKNRYVIKDILKKTGN